ncbi:malectin domain-containing carbohydrate-binding protein, partial [Flavobacterium sp. ASW18X]|uniref:malectin domain-containing carbohydrate-binding protein n=1 Tax=Flavobacterium sp. ASW18X TaxID=2572595 RepID=UPI0010AE8F58
VFKLSVTDSQGAQAEDEMVLTVIPANTGAFSLHINAGGEHVVNNGITYVSDQYYDIGSTLSRPQTGLSQPYSSIRYSRSQEMNYSIPLPNGNYEV